MDGNLLFKVGKHKGKSFEEVYRSDKGYTTWVLGLDGANGNLFDFQEYCRGIQGGRAGQQGRQQQQVRIGRQSASQFSASRGPGTFPSAASASAAPGNASAAVPQAKHFSDQRYSVDAEKFVLGLHSVPGFFALSWENLSGSEAAVRKELESWGGRDVPIFGSKSTRSNAYAFPNARKAEIMGKIKDNATFRFNEAEGQPSVLPLPYWVQKLDTRRSQKQQEANLQRQQRGLSSKKFHVFPDLLPYQVQGIEFCVNAGGRCIIGDEMGLGKTVQALGVAWYYRLKSGNANECWPVQIICPSMLRSVWRDQAEHWIGALYKEKFGEDLRIQVIKKGTDTIDPHGHLVIVSYDMFAKQVALQQQANGQAFHLLIVDEAHYIKDQRAKRSAAVINASKKTPKVLLLSGTPARNRPQELFVLVDIALSTDEKSTGTYASALPGWYNFYNRYSTSSRNNFNGLEWSGVRRPLELTGITTGLCMIRRLKKDVLTQLPDKRRVQIMIPQSELNKTAMKGYEAIQSDGSITHTPALFAKLAEAKVDYAGRYIEELLKENEEKFLVFAHHKLVLEHLQKVVEKQKVAFIRIDGNTSMERRPALVEQFQREDSLVRIALLSITACGTGITLTAASKVIFVEYHWVPSDLQQAEDRAHRIGQKNAVTIEYLTAKGTYDEHMYRAVNSKVQKTSLVLDGKEKEHLQAQDTEALQQDTVMPRAADASTSFSSTAKNHVCLDGNTFHKAEAEQPAPKRQRLDEAL